jgi:hypothetical protein
MTTTISMLAIDLAKGSFVPFNIGIPARPQHSIFTCRKMLRQRPKPLERPLTFSARSQFQGPMRWCLRLKFDGATGDPMLCLKRFGLNLNREGFP